MQDNDDMREAIDEAFDRALSEKLGVSEKAEWVPYEGPQGGQGWQNTETGDVTYDEEPPGEALDEEEARAEAEESLISEMTANPEGEIAQEVTEATGVDDPEAAAEQFLEDAGSNELAQVIQGTGPEGATDEEVRDAVEDAESDAGSGVGDHEFSDFADKQLDNARENASQGNEAEAKNRTAMAARDVVDDPQDKKTIENLTQDAMDSGGMGSPSFDEEGLLEAVEENVSGESADRFKQAYEGLSTGVMANAPDAAGGAAGDVPDDDSEGGGDGEVRDDWDPREENPESAEEAAVSLFPSKYAGGDPEPDEETREIADAVSDLPEGASEEQVATEIESLGWGSDQAERFSKGMTDFAGGEGDDGSSNDGDDDQTISLEGEDTDNVRTAARNAMGGAIDDGDEAAADQLQETARKIEAGEPITEDDAIAILDRKNDAMNGADHQTQKQAVDDAMSALEEELGIDGVADRLERLNEWREDQKASLEEKLDSAFDEALGDLA